MHFYHGGFLLRPPRHFLAGTTKKIFPLPLLPSVANSLSSEGAAFLDARAAGTRTQHLAARLALHDRHCPSHCTPWPRASHIPRLTRSAPPPAPARCGIRRLVGEWWCRPPAQSPSPASGPSRWPATRSRGAASTSPRCRSRGLAHMPPIAPRGVSPNVSARGIFSPTFPTHITGLTETRVAR